MLNIKGQFHRNREWEGHLRRLEAGEGRKEREGVDQGGQFLLDGRRRLWWPTARHGATIIMCMFQKCWNTRFLMFSSLKKDKLTKWWLCELSWSVFPMTHICRSKCHIVSFQISTITIYRLKRNILTKNKTPSKGKCKVIAVLSFPSRWQRQEFLSFYTYLPSIQATFLLMT